MLLLVAHALVTTAHKLPAEVPQQDSPQRCHKLRLKDHPSRKHHEVSYLERRVREVCQYHSYFHPGYMQVVWFISLNPEYNVVRLLIYKITLIMRFFRIFWYKFQITLYKNIITKSGITYYSVMELL